MACPTVDFIENYTGQKLKNIKKLNLEDMSFRMLNADIVNEMANLTSLNLSGNNLRSIPPGLVFPKLRHLNVSDNQLTCMMFLKQFPHLTKLHMDGNPLEHSDKYIAVSLCPHLKTLNGSDAHSLRSIIKTYRDKIWPQVEGVWGALFSEVYEGSIPETEVAGVQEQFMIALGKQKINVSDSLLKFAEYVLEVLAKELVDMAQAGSYEPPTKRPRTSCGTPGTPSKFTVIKRKGIVGRLPAVGDYKPVHFLRCHSGGSKEHMDNDPTDDQTQVWKSEFEPHPHKPGELTGVVATAGGNTVCLIDCNTGKVMKRYKQVDEHFYTVAWSTIQMKHKDRAWSTNILAAAGVEGHVKLLHPEQLVCYHEFSVPIRDHKEASYINCLLFHSERPTTLFCGASDGNITAWDVGVPQGPEYKTRVTSLFTLRSRTDGILNMVRSRDDMLVAGCEGGCMVWNIKPHLHGKQRDPCMELVMPGKGEQNVDGLTVLGDDLVACKVAEEGCICLWRLKSVLGSKKKQVKVNPLCVLEWCQTETLYLNLGGSKKGLLACGDDQGRIWLYNVAHLLKTSREQNEELCQPSRVLSWPGCEMQGKRDYEALMIDLLEKPKLLIVNHVNVSVDNQFLIASMENNIVAIWRREQMN